jgi:hypothetical protein
LEADSLYRAHLERYAASLAAASGNPSLSLGAVAALSPYSMLAAGYPPAALGLVAQSPLIQQPPLPDTLSSVAASTLSLSSLSSRNLNLPLHPNHSQNSVSLSGPKPVFMNSNLGEDSRASSAITSSPVLQQRLSNPIEHSDVKDSTQLKVAPKNTAPSTVGQNEPDTTKNGQQHRKEKKKLKANHANKSKAAGIANFYELFMKYPNVNVFTQYYYTYNY